jgi:hypothetical protein
MTHHHHTAVTSQGSVYNKPTPAPEINPEAGMAAILLLAGTLAILTAKRRAK